MRALQKRIVQEFQVKPEIQPEQEFRVRVEFLKEYLRTSTMKGFVLGISGGVDSTLSAYIGQTAVAELREETGAPYQFVAVRLPFGTQQDEDDAQRALQFVQPDRTVTFNIGPAVQAFDEEFTRAWGDDLPDFHKGNAKARMRMIAQYAIGGAAGSLLVIGTDHAAEGVVGFFTKYGDGGADVLPLNGLNKRQVRMILQFLGADEVVYSKVPTADLLDAIPQRPDEVELGVTYEQIDDYLEGKTIPDEAAENIERRYLQTRNKRNMPVSVFDDWWKE